MKTAVERVKELRESGMSMDEAKRLIQRQDLRDEILRASSIDELKAVLLIMAGRF